MLLPLRAQPEVDAPALLRHALHLADLYNWVDAAPEFAKAETTFLASGDQKNALYARIGLMRGNLEHCRTIPSFRAINRCGCSV
jgi:hypothetical protein